MAGYVITCDEAVFRDGFREPCGEVAVARAHGEDGGTYPVCVYHTRKTTAVPLRHECGEQ